jgi:hypothetical protein
MADPVLVRLRVVRPSRRHWTAALRTGGLEKKRDIRIGLIEFPDVSAGRRTIGAAPRTIGSIA